MTCSLVRRYLKFDTTGSVEATATPLLEQEFEEVYDYVKERVDELRAVRRLPAFLEQIDWVPLPLVASSAAGPAEGLELLLGCRRRMSWRQRDLRDGTRLRRWPSRTRS